MSVPMEPDISGVQQTLDLWEQAMRGGDVETLAELITEDAEFWTNGLPPLIGRDALREAFAPFFSKYEAEQEFECQELIVSDDIAFMRGTEINRLTPRDGGEGVERRQRAFSVLRRGGDGRWRFARGMTNSPP